MRLRDLTRENWHSNCALKLRDLQGFIPPICARKKSKAILGHVVNRTHPDHNPMMIARRSKGHLRLVTAARSDRHEPYFMAVWRCQFYLSGHLGDNITLKKLSEISGLHQRSLLVAFNRITGTSPKAYVRRLRLQRVHDVLQKSRHRRGSIIYGSRT